jgi:hypothetical protein
VPTTVPPPTTSLPARDSAPTSLPEFTLKGYTALALLKGVVAALEDLAAQAERGPASDTHSAASAVGQRIALAAFLQAIDGNLAQDAPDPALAGAWDIARAQAPEIRHILSQWANQQITPQEVATRLAPIRLELDQMLTTARQELTRTYGIDAERLSSVMADALARIQAAAPATPTE